MSAGFLRLEGKTMSIYSENNERMIPKEVFYKGHKYVWNESDELYYREDTEELALTLDYAESL